MPTLNPYRAELPYSYALGIFPSLALMQAAPQRARRLLLSQHAQGEGLRTLRELCAKHQVREEFADKTLRRISGKENCFAALAFEKWQAELEAGLSHVVLVNPMDEGNLGTIQRTLLGFRIPDLAVIRPAADIFAPHGVRSSMGAIFSMRVKAYESFESYRESFPGHNLYPFMLDGAATPEEAAPLARQPYSLIFGNEGNGLPPVFSTLGQAVRIPHSNDIDSLNLAVAVAIGAYAFTQTGREESSCTKQWLRS
ncbi:MAG: TrmH family RNA methyltransferase [Clostridia bacterium]|nr:TrmH family RNA methyltransferase [Clostridia bacterium]